MFDKAGVDLTKEPLVGVGSCRRPRLDLPVGLLADLAQAGIRIHAFGFKKAGPKIAYKSVVSADSLAWSYGRRHERGCIESHQRENNCKPHALWWRQDLLDHITDAQRRCPTTSIITPRPADLRAMQVGDPHGFTQRWRYGTPTWHHVSEGGFRAQRHPGGHREGLRAAAPLPVRLAHRPAPPLRTPQP